MVEFDSNYTAKFYDVYGEIEWGRLEATPYGGLQATIHADFIERHMQSGDRVLDAGCGPGRFTAVTARLGATATALDVSERQLQVCGSEASTHRLREDYRTSPIFSPIVSMHSGAGQIQY